MQLRMFSTLLRSSHPSVRQFYVRFYSEVDVFVQPQDSRKCSAQSLKYDETSYYFENGLRKVYPYYFTFNTYAKLQWFEQKLVDVYTKEFRTCPVAMYERCLRDGIATVNGERVEPDYHIKQGDLLSHTVHRHEAPVIAASIPIVHVDADLVVVDKPTSIPVHPCGRYRHNTVMFIMAKEHGIENLKTIHRIDRLTSGLVLLGRTVPMASLMNKQMRERQIEKEYICRVQGHFPGETIECHEPIGAVCKKIGVSKVAPSGKPCSTQFQLLSRSSSSSVVLCRPRTGRTHQIRVHLQYLGYPILNDPLYNHTAFGANKGKGGITEVTDEQVLKGLNEDMDAKNYPFVGEGGPGGQHEEVQQGRDGVVSCPPSPQQLPGTNSDVCRDDYGFKPHLKTVDKNCYECKVRYRDPKPKDLVMFLHALKYSGPGWQFETKMPDWAAPDWVDNEDSHHILD